MTHRHIVSATPVILVLLAAVLPTRSAPHDPVVPAKGVPRAALPLMAAAPAIDGAIDEAEWADAVRNVGFVSHGARRVTHRDSVFWVGCDGTNLCLALKTEAAPDGSILARGVPDGKRDLKAAFFDDSIELVLDPKRGRTEGSREYYHIITNGRKALYDLALDPDNRQNPLRTAWRMGEWTLEHQVRDGWWHVEIAIPLASMDATPADLATPWGVRVARNWRRPGEQSQWESVGTDYNNQVTMPVVTWDPAAPVVHVLSLHENRERAKIAVAVRNPHTTPLDVTVHLSDAWHRNPPRESTEELHLAGGQVRTVTLEPPDGGAEGLHRTVIRVTDREGKNVYYLRDYRWGLQRPDDVWSLGEEEKKAVALLFKYYPYHNRIRLKLDVGGLAAKDKVTGAAAVIRRLGDDGKPRGDALWEEALEFDALVAEGIHEIPGLADGRYVLCLTLEGGEGVPVEPVLQEFTRKHFEWEHNKLGIDSEVMAPFTPMSVKDGTVSCVLREHRHGQSGLWDAVSSQGRSLLTGPMSWDVVTAKPGAEPASAAVAGTGWTCESTAPTGVLGRASWTAGALKATVETTYDYDGMMLVALGLSPTGGESVHRLTLSIPVTEAEARYMHACGDGLRHNYAGFVPAGEGRVWDSSQGNKIEIATTFYPYLWIGGGERGICWFADNARDWVLDHDTPTLELARQGETLLLRVHFITRPGPLTRPHRIVFGLQATPTKPMPEGWRRWTARKPVRGGRPITWLGHTMYWGGILHDLYPYEHNFEFFEQMRKTRESGTIPTEFRDRWMANIAKTWPKGTPAYKRFLAHVNAGLRGASGARWEGGTRFFGYTNARGIGFAAPEFATFQDEWLRFAWYGRDWNPRGGISYDVSPSASFIDFALWYYRKMLTWNDGVYWDNTFLSAHFDPVVGNAWIDEDGKVRPGMGLFHLRNLIKRTAIMHWQESRDMHPSRKPLVSLSHMTNTQLVPVLSFGNCNMDWEWKYGFEDFQDRFSPDLTVAQTIARQVGAWGTILAGGHPDPKDPRTAWVWRTRLGVCLVHEIKNFDYRPASDTELYGKLFDFGYGLPGCKVFNYWDEPHPIRATGADVRTLAMAKDGEALVVVTDYGEGGTCEVQLDAAVLGVKPAAAAADFETDEAIERVGDGRYRFALKKHDFKILRVE